MAKRLFSYRHRGHYFTVVAYQRFGLVGQAHKRWQFVFGLKGDGHKEQDFTSKTTAMQAAYKWAEANEVEPKA